MVEDGGEVLVVDVAVHEERHKHHSQHHQQQHEVPVVLLRLEMENSTSAKLSVMAVFSMAHVELMIRQHTVHIYFYI